MTHEEVALKEKEKLELRYADLKSKKEHIKAVKEALGKEVEEYNEQLKEYRMKSVYRILDFVSWNSHRLKHSTINRLLVHCKNKLNGNIDGMEITLDFDYSIEEGKARKENDNT